jgi:hypothetical protein
MRTLKLFIVDDSSPVTIPQEMWIRQRCSPLDSVYLAPDIGPKRHLLVGSFVQVLAELARPQTRGELARNIATVWERLPLENNVVPRDNAVVVVASPPVIGAIYNVATHSDFPSKEITQLPAVLCVKGDRGNCTVSVACSDSALAYRPQ